METTIREEQYLAKYAGEDVPVPAPRTRMEKYLAKMAGSDVEMPSPKTREEQIFKKIAESGGGGGGNAYLGLTTATLTIRSNTFPEGARATTVTSIDEITMNLALGENDYVSIDLHSVPLTNNIIELPFKQGGLNIYSAGVWANTDAEPYTLSFYDSTFSGDISFDTDTGYLIVNGNGTVDAVWDWLD